MSTGAIIAIVVAVVVVLAILFLLVPRMRGGMRQRQLESRRHDAAQAHRTAAERRLLSGKVRYHGGSTTVMTDAPYIMA